MSEKSINKMKVLLKNAGASARWWETNREAAQKYDMGVFALLMLVGTIIVAAPLTGAWWVMSSSSFLEGGLKMLAVAAGEFGLMTAAGWLFQKMHASLRQKFKDGWELFGFDCKIEFTSFTAAEISESVLRAARSIPLPEVQHLRSSLEKLQSAPLPKSWWAQMETLLKEIEDTLDTVPLPVSPQSLDEVYVEIAEHLDPSQGVSKNVLKL